MGKLIILKPQLPAEIVSHEGPVGLEDLYRLVGCDTVDCLRLGDLPTGIGTTLWCDDNGLLNDALVNRRVNDHVLCGTLLLTGLEPGSGESVAFNDFEAALVLATVRRWPVLPADTQKPEATFRFIESSGF